MRVIVNRIWRWNMGSGIVETPNNFGVAGDRPSDPDCSNTSPRSSSTTECHWKKLIKEIVMSRDLSSSARQPNENQSRQGSATTGSTGAPTGGVWKRKASGTAC